MSPCGTLCVACDAAQSLISRHWPFFSTCFFFLKMRCRCAPHDPSGSNLSQSKVNFETEIVATIELKSWLLMTHECGATAHLRALRQLLRDEDRVDQYLLGLRRCLTAKDIELYSASVATLRGTLRDLAARAAVAEATLVDAHNKLIEAALMCPLTQRGGGCTLGRMQTSSMIPTDPATLPPAATFPTLVGRALGCAPASRDPRLDRICAALYGGLESQLRGLARNTSASIRRQAAEALSAENEVDDCDVHPPQLFLVQSSDVCGAH